MACIPKHSPWCMVRGMHGMHPLAFTMVHGMHAPSMRCVIPTPPSVWCMKGYVFMRLHLGFVSLALLHAWDCHGQC